MNDNIVLTIGRQNGSGGRQIGEALAIKLGFSFYDKELIHEASKQSGLNKEFFEHIDEKASYSLFGGFFGTHSPMMEDVYSGYYLSNESLFTIQSNAIRSLADQKSCVFVGRCADYVLKDYPQCLNIFICGDIEDRIKRISDNYQIPLQKAKETIEKMDKKRAGYYNYFSNKVWGAASSYHLCINSSYLGIEGSVNLIHQMIKEKFGC